MSIICWNIDGLKNKLTDLDCISYLQKFDIFGLIETWEQTENEVTKDLFPDYNSVFCAAIKTAKHGRAMSGLIVFIRKRLEKLVTKLKVDCNFAIFLKCNKCLFNVDKDVILSFIYLPPYGSTFYEDKHLSGISLFENTFIPLYNDNNYYLLLGDFNSRTGTLNDFDIFDNNVDSLEEYEEIFDSFDLPRSSCDNYISAFGRSLLDFCKIYSIYILNGRVGQDKSIGEYTYIGTNGCSVIDYGLASKILFSSIIEFNIEPTESTHSPILLMIQSKCINDDNSYKTTQMENCRDKSSFSKKPDDIIRFVENVKCKYTNEFIHSLTVKIENTDIDIDDILSEIVNSFSTLAIKRKKFVPNTEQRPWFDKECQDLKKLKLHLLHRFRNTRSENNLLEYKNARKTFRNIVDEKRLEYNTKSLDSLISSMNDSKSFWSKLKALTRKHKPNSVSGISIGDWLTHFETLFANQSEEEITDDIEIEVPDSEIENLIFNSEITEDEIVFAVKSLRAGKAPGPDGIIPEMFINTIDIILPILNKLFNRLFLRGEFPGTWSKSIMIPIHKKGDINSADNYRGISLLDIFGKIYTSILNRRLTFFVNMYNKITESQAGFREGYSTIDNAFILMSLIQKYLTKKKSKLYVCFVDFQKAFDSVHRDKLWKVLNTVGIKGNLFKVIKSMYACVKACVRVNNEFSEFFDCPLGLKQGCVLSPVIFSIFINDLALMIENSGTRGIQLFPDLTEIFLLLFADDIALTSDTVLGLQKQIDTLKRFCNEYKMVVNVIKTKVMVFRRGGPLSKRETWLYDGNVLEVVNGFQYVGLLFSTKISFYRMAEELSRKGKRVLVTVLQSLTDLGNLNKLVVFKIFDVKVCPMLLYGSELWGLEPKESVERVQYYLCKRFLNVSFKANNNAVLGECGRFPLYIETAKRAIKYWNKILHMPAHRYVWKCYKMLYYLDSRGQHNWATEVKNILCTNGFGFIWEEQCIPNEKLFLKEFTKSLRDQFEQKWREGIESSHKFVLYKEYKTNFIFERYLDVLKIGKFRHIFASFRLSCHCLEIEIGRHRGIERENRKCPFCMTTTEDEYHFLLICDKYLDIRRQYLPEKYINNPNMHKFNMIMSTQNEITIQSLAMYLHYAFKRRRSALENY